MECMIFWHTQQCLIWYDNYESSYGEPSCMLFIFGQLSRFENKNGGPRILKSQYWLHQRVFFGIACYYGDGGGFWLNWGNF